MNRGCARGNKTKKATGLGSRYDGRARQSAGPCMIMMRNDIIQAKIVWHARWSASQLFIDEGINRQVYCEDSACNTQGENRQGRQRRLAGQLMARMQARALEKMFQAFTKKGRTKCAFVLHGVYPSATVPQASSTWLKPSWTEGSSVKDRATQMY